MRRALTLLLPALLLSAASPAAAGDLAGYWTVEGALPDGTGYSGHAALARAGEDRYRLIARARLENGRWLNWRANAEREGDVLVVRHLAARGLVGSVLGSLGGAPPTPLGRYAIDEDEQAFGGAYALEGSAETGRARYVRQADPVVRFEPDALEVRAGETAVVAVRCEPEEATGLLWFEGDAVARAFWEEGVRKLELEPSGAPGPSPVQARLGPPGGRTLAELALTVQRRILDEVVARVRAAVAAGERPIVAFDLDDTLFDTRYRVRAIMRDYGAQVGDERLERLSVRDVHYELEETLREIGFSEEEIAGQAGRAARRAWSRRFFSASSYALDRPIRGALAYVDRLVEAGARVVYVTGRAERTRQGTIDVLAAAGLPIDEVYHKPDPAPGQPKEPTASYKERIAREVLDPTGRIVACFDNEPKNANAFRRAAPDAIVVWLDTLYEPDGPALLPGIARVPDLR